MARKQAPHRYRPWQSEADTSPGLSHSEYREDLIYETPAIRRFLDDHRAQKYIISAPKGYGKTLILIAKAAQIRETSGGLITGAGGQLVDRPAGVFRNFSEERIFQLKGDYQYWKNLWKISFMASAVKNWYKRRGGSKLVELESHHLLEKAILDDTLYSSPCSFFTMIMDLPPNDQIRIVGQLGKLEAAFSAISSQVAFAVDNVDEYFKPMLQDGSANESEAEGVYYQRRSNDIWTLAQLALAGAAFEITRANNHVKAFCTIRREAFIKLEKYDDQLQQILGATVSIEYNQDDLRAIFEKNINMMDMRELVEPGSQTPTGRFVGSANSKIEHRVVSKEEGLFEFLLRHTVRRPRDLMLFGEKLSDLSPNRRSSKDEIRECVAEASKGVVSALLTEMRPFFPIPDMDALLSLVSKNAMTLNDLSSVQAEYVLKKKMSMSEVDERCHPFCTLYRVGLLGIVSRALYAEKAHQSFLKPFEITFNNDNGLPSTDEYYLIHPALDQKILEQAGIKYLVQYHSSNIIGDDLEWTEPLQAYFVIKCDVVAFSEIMNTELYHTVANRIQAWARSSGESLTYYDVFGGDSVLFIDKNPAKVVRAAHTLLKSARDYIDKSIAFRLAGSAGPLSFQRLESLYSGNLQQIEYPLGLCLRHAARIEPFVTPGCIVVDEEFYRRAGGLTAFSFDQVEEMGNLEKEGEEFIVRKNIHDAPYRTRLWVVRSEY